MSDQVKQALSNITESLCHPLKSRIEHVISTEAPATVLYSVTTLIRFYRAITEQVIPDSVLDLTLSDLLAQSEKSFLSRLQRETRVALGERAEPPGNDLVPAPSVSRLLSLLNEILSVASIAEDRERDMLQVCLMENIFLYSVFTFVMCHSPIFGRSCRASSIRCFKRSTRRRLGCRQWTWPSTFSIVCIKYSRPWRCTNTWTRD